MLYVDVTHSLILAQVEAETLLERVGCSYRFWGMLICATVMPLVKPFSAS